jgi:hypothetical protein
MTSPPVRSGKTVMKPSIVRDGPRVLLGLVCVGCRFDTSEYYCIEDGNDIDSGFNHYCTHPDVCLTDPCSKDGRLATQGSPLDTCPFRKKAVQEECERFIREA